MAKYGFETEYIWVLIEMREITVDYERSGIDIISDDSVQEFMSRNEKGATLMYIAILLAKIQRTGNWIVLHLWM